VCVYRQIFGSLNNNRRLAGEPSGEPAAKLVAAPRRDIRTFRRKIFSYHYCIGIHL